MNNPILTKVCGRCKVEKPVDGFGKNKYNKDGLSYVCIECRRKRDNSPEEKSRRKEYDARPERIEAREKYRKSPRGKLVYKKIHDKWVNSPEGKAWLKEWYSSPIGQIYKKNNNGSENSKKCRREYIKKWKTSPEGKAWFEKYKKTPQHKAGMVRGRQKRKANINNAESTLTNEQWLKILKEHPNCCICGEPFLDNDKIIDIRDKLTQEHIVPVSLGGGYTYENILPAHYGCNSKKWSKLDKGKLNTWFYLYKS